MIAPMGGGGGMPAGAPQNNMIRSQLGPMGPGTPAPPMGQPPLMGRGTLAPGGGAPVQQHPLTNSGAPGPQRPFGHIGNPRMTNPIQTTL